MSTRRRIAELCVWAILAFLGGLLPAWTDLRPGGVQGPALFIMMVNFALTLPGRAPVVLVAVASWLGLPLMHGLVYGKINPALLVALVPALIAGVGGRIFGSLLDTAAGQLTEPAPDVDAPWYRRPLPTRFLLAVSLTGIALSGVPILAGVVRALALRAPSDWQVMVWMIVSLLGWIAMAPVILRQRPLLRRLRGDDSPGVRPIEFATHIVVIVALALVHTAVVLALSVLLAIPVGEHWRELSAALFSVFLPLDLLAYLAILALGFASDVERNRRLAAARAVALEAQSLEHRLSALRARLNPHFLFNALNSVTVLARSDRPKDAADVLDGLTSLLRYVLDDRRAAVPLGEELEFARRYLAVQHARFGDRLKSEVSSTEEANGVLVPQLLLQPIVENAVEHGVAHTLDGGTVVVNASATSDALHVTVSDDGPGPADDATQDGIGLASTRERLAHLFGDRAVLHLGRASAGRGTRVEIVVPRGA